MRDIRNNIRVYFQPAFLICVAVLTTAGAGMSIAVKGFGVYLKKEPLPLKKSFDFLDESDLASYRVISKIKIENEEIITALGTEDYIQWILEDTEAADNSAAEKFMLFITYYQLPDRVPHVPEECYAGGGFQKLASDSVTLEINNNAGFERKFRGKHLVFGNTKANLWQRGEKFPVLYLFKVNGEYAASREEARIALNKNLFRKFSYFCKIELVFNQTLIPPNKEQAIKAGEKLLAVILPVLETKHWPDWEK
ncbi:MAG: hypothetical protein FVQ84_06155 [Planctomycetes bacterium]|nr:hypothetical protein [Planctomycetota bacterium]